MSDLDLRLRAWVELGPDPMLEVDPDGRVTAANQRATEWFGEVAGRSLGDLLTGPVEVLAAPPAAGVTLELSMPGRSLSARAVPHAGRPGAAVVALRDVTTDADRRRSAVARLASGIAHEINNPLTVLQLRLDLLLEDPGVDPGVVEQLSVLRDTLGRVGRTVRTLQRLGRSSLEAGAPVEVSRLVHTVVAAARGWAGAAPVTVDAVPPAAVFGDPAALELAVEQLVAHVTDPLGGRIEVVVADRWVSIRVHAEVARWSTGVVSDPNRSAAADARFPGIGLVVAAAVARDHGGVVRTVRDGATGWVALELPEWVER